MKLSDIIITPLRRIETVGGDVLHAMKQTDKGYNGFGEAYFSWVSPGAIKAWKLHSQMTMNVMVPVGKVRFVFRCINYQGLDEFRVEDIGTQCYARLTIPPGIWFGFQGLHSQRSLVLNIANIQHDDNEVERLNLNDISWDWSKI